MSDPQPLASEQTVDVSTFGALGFLLGIRRNRRTDLRGDTSKIGNGVLVVTRQIGRRATPGQPRAKS